MCVKSDFISIAISCCVCLPTWQGCWPRPCPWRGLVPPEFLQVHFPPPQRCSWARQIQAAHLRPPLISDITHTHTRIKGQICSPQQSNAHTLDLPHIYLDCSFVLIRPPGEELRVQMKVGALHPQSVWPLSLKVHWLKTTTEPNHLTTEISNTLWRFLIVLWFSPLSPWVTSAVSPSPARGSCCFRNCNSLWRWEQQSSNSDQPTIIPKHLLMSLQFVLYITWRLWGLNVCSDQTNSQTILVVHDTFMIKGRRIRTQSTLLRHIHDDLKSCGIGSANIPVLIHVHYSFCSI